MKWLPKLLGLILVAILQWQFVAMLFAPAHEPSFRRKERSVARREYRANPSDETRAAFDLEVSQLNKHETIVAVATFGSFLIVDWVAVFLYGLRKKQAA